MAILKYFGKKKPHHPVNINKQTKYETLVHRYHQDLYRYAYWLCQDRSIAQDIVQETCLRAWKSLDSLQDDKSAKAWLITILRRENARRFERKQLKLVDIDDVTNEIQSDDDQHHQQQWLHIQIMNLEVDYREPLFLQVVAGFTGEEIAEILQINKNTVMTRLFRARNQLKEMLDKQSQPRGQQNG